MEVAIALGAIGAVATVCCTAIAIERAYIILKEKPTKPLDLCEAERIHGKKLAQFIEETRETLGMDIVNFYNFAVVGNSGVGKSTLINRFRLLDDKAQGSARVGETETTTEIRKYAHSEHSHIILWDLPGAGTQSHPASTYFTDKMLYAFDCILILSSDRFLEVDFHIAKEALRHGRPCAFVRTKADISVRSVATREGMTMLEASGVMRTDVERSLRKGLEMCGCSPEHMEQYRLFIVCAHAFTNPSSAYKLFDFETEKVDDSLKNMDEDNFYIYVANSVVNRQDGREQLPERCVARHRKGPIESFLLTKLPLKLGFRKGKGKK